MGRSEVGCCSGRVPVLKAALEEAQLRSTTFERWFKAAVKHHNDLTVERDEAQGKLEAVREQVAYGFTGETLKNLHEGMSAREMNEWWRKTLDRILFEEDDEKGTCPTCHQPRIKYDAEGFPTNGY